MSVSDNPDIAYNETLYALLRSLFFIVICCYFYSLWIVFPTISHVSRSLLSSAMHFSPCSFTHHISHIKSFINSCPLFSTMGQCQGCPHLLLTLLGKLLGNPCWGCRGNKRLLTIAVCVVLLYSILLESRWALILAETCLLLSP